jgi:plasmid stabilization system protein ParE
MSVRVRIAGRAEADLTHQYRWYLDNAGVFRVWRFKTCRPIHAVMSAT